MVFNIEKKTRWLVSTIVLVTALIYVFASFGKTEWILWATAILGILLGLFLYAESGIIEYYRQKKYRNISVSDVFVWLGFIFGTVIILNSITIITAIRNVTPTWLLSFLSINGAIAGGIAGILAIVFMFTPMPE